MVTLVLAIVVVSGAATYALLRPFLIQRLDQQLSSIALENSNQILQCFQRGTFQAGTAEGCTLGASSGDQVLPASVDEWFVAYNSDGDVELQPKRSRATSLKLLSLSQSDIRRVLANPTKSRTVTTTDGSQLRVTARSILPPGQDSYTIVTGLSTNEVRHTLRRLLLIEVAIGAAAVALAAGLTAWGVRAGLRPLLRVTRTAQEVTAELGPDGAGLDRRVPNADPTTEVGQVASSVNTLLGAVENEFAARVRSEDRMRQFLADASHELRTPLTSIRGYAELSRLKGQSTDSSDDPMRRIEVEGTRMSRLVEDLLVLARGDDRTNELRQEPVSVEGLLNDALRTVESAHPERRFDLVNPGEAVVIGDRDQLLRLLLNLLNNAAVHTDPAGPIRLEGIRGRTPTGPAVALRVVDAGPGLPPSEAAHVFERFWRADKARSRAKGGSGLGMAIVAQIAAAHGGSVDFASSVEGGTTVTVTLPLAPSGTNTTTGGGPA